MKTAKNILAWLAVNAFFVAINVIAGGLMLGLYTLVKMVDERLVGIPLVVVPVGLLAVAGAVWCAFVAVRELNRVRL